jgi:predicted hydrocarbon binding protein
MAPPASGPAAVPALLRQLHASLAAHAPDQLVTILQETGYVAGEATYRAFADWLPARAGVSNPAELDSELLPEMLSDFFASEGWGSVSITPVGTGALALDSADWVEADPGTAPQPMCFFTAGMLADFLGRLSGGGETVAVMEVECRSKGDERCRFLSAAPEVLDKVYNEMTAGRTYEEALR